MSLEILQNDVAFSTSPDAGDAECLCSRCLKVIPEEDGPVVRAWTQNESGVVDEHSKEYRYCKSCHGLWK